MDEERVFLISETQRQAVLDYLMKRPYVEVAQGVQMLLTLPEQVAKVNLEQPE